MAKYKYYIAKSMRDNLQEDEREMRFHFRMKLSDESKSPPYLKFNTEVECPVVAERTVKDGCIFYVIHIWLKETNRLTDSRLGENSVFKEVKNNCEKIICKIITHTKKPDGKEVEKEEEEDLVYELMPAEYPAG